jgi:hypothetical protein
MPRRPFHRLLLLSLLLAAALGTLQLLSFHRVPGVWWLRQTCHQFYIERGAIVVEKMALRRVVYRLSYLTTQPSALATQEPRWTPFQPQWRLGWVDGTLDGQLAALGNNFNTFERLPEWVVHTERSTRIPAWAPLPVYVLLAGIWLRRFVPRRQHQRRLRDGLCTACGYDLRGSPGRCPECGLAPDAPALKASSA